MLERLALIDLANWKIAYKRRPLIVTGARQTGKSSLVSAFGKEYFENTVLLNFEYEPELREVFSSLDPLEIVSQIAILKSSDITSGKTLLFLDEIQESVEAMKSLRYFFEKMPDLHVIAAGSLLNIVLDKEKELSFPVGRVEYLRMYPLSFREFLMASSEEGLLNTLDALTLQNVPKEAIHRRFLQEFEKYLFCGGMPAVVDAYVHADSGTRFRDLQESLLRSYMDDFGKYRTRIDRELLSSVFRGLPTFAGKNFRFSHFLPSIQSSRIRHALELFELAGVIHLVKRSYANGTPLSAEETERDPKFLFVDSGLMLAGLGFNKSVAASTFDASWNRDLSNSGNLAEQIVGQELLVLNSSASTLGKVSSIYDTKLHYWKRDKSGSTAEVDYLLERYGRVLPIEVKAGSTGRLKSLRMFIEQKKAPFGIRISQLPLSFYEGILSVPVYAVGELDRLIEGVLK